MILSSSDRAIYFPSVPESAVSDNLLLTAQALAEGYNGANRKLEVTQYTEYYEGSCSGYRLHYLPVVTNTIAIYTQYSYSLDWISAASSTWVLENNKVMLRNRRMPARVKVVYQAGFGNSTPGIDTLKLALGQLVQYLCSATSGQQQTGITASSIDGEYSVQFDASQLQDGIPRRYMLPFRQYLPTQVF